MHDRFTRSAPLRAPAPVGFTAFVALLGLGALGGGCVDKSDDTGSTPNLYISGLLCESEGGEVSCDVLVENNGAAVSDSFKVGLYLDHSGAPEVGEGGDDQAQIGGIAAGGLESVTLRGPACGSCKIWALVDSKGSVDETDESDNASGPTTIGG